MRVYVVNSFAELHNAICDHRIKPNENWIFRGQTGVSLLKPLLGREPYCHFEELPMFTNWYKKTRALLRQYGTLSDWDLLCFARHYGIPTRLLDWTFNPLVAAFFAVEEDSQTDSVIYCLNSSQLNEADETVSPFNQNEDVICYDPGSLIERNVNQCASFTVHKNSNIPLESLPIQQTGMHKIVIKDNYRDQLMHELSFYNIHYGTLFPDLVGIEKRKKWQFNKALAQLRLQGLIS